MNLNNLPAVNPFFLYFAFIWSLFWKGLALWRAAKKNQKNWFVSILVLNTLGVLEILYLFYFAKEKMKLNELAFWKKK